MKKNKKNFQQSLKFLTFLLATPLYMVYSNDYTAIYVVLPLDIKKGFGNEG